MAAARPAPCPLPRPLQCTVNSAVSNAVFTLEQLLNRTSLDSYNSAVQSFASQVRLAQLGTGADNIRPGLAAVLSAA